MKAIASEWWRDFNSHYPPYMGELKDDGAILTQLNTEQFVAFVKTNLRFHAGANILDVGCGPGKYSIDLASQGFNVVGIDINETFINYAKRNAKRILGVLEKNAKFIFSDMRNIPFRNYFDCVFNVGTSFGFFDNDEDNYRVLEEIANSLNPRGIFLLDVGNRDWYLKNLLYKDWHRHADGTVTIMERRFDYSRSRIIATFETIGGASKETWGYSWRAYTLAETIEMFKRVGLSLSNAFGDWEGGEYSVDSKRMILVSKKIS